MNHTTEDQSIHQSTEDMASYVNINNNLAYSITLSTTSANEAIYSMTDLEDSGESLYEMNTEYHYVEQVPTGSECNSCPQYDYIQSSDYKFYENTTCMTVTSKASDDENAEYI